LKTRPLVLMVSGNAPPVRDGVGDCTDRLLEELARQRPGWRWVWLSRRPRWFHSPLVRRGAVTLVRPTHGWRWPDRVVAAGFVRALRPDLVHIQDQIHSFHETDAAVRIADAAKAVGSALVTTLHEYHVERPSVRHTTALVHRSDVVIANDPRNAERCLSEAGRAVDATWWSGTTVLPPEPADRPATRPGLVSTFGFLSGLKALEPVAEALRRLRPEFPQLHWRIIGPFEPASNPHHAELARRIGPDGVEFTGAVPFARLAGLLGESELMLLPFADGASERRTSLHAAWAFGLPVVTTPPPTTATTIVDEDNCLLVREPTADAWADSLRRVLTDPSLAARLRAGSLRAADRFSWRRLAENHLEVYERLLSSL
jgi:glycosyltransferase involved in cell wall biosynthesis